MPQRSASWLSAAPSSPARGRVSNTAGGWRQGDESRAGAEAASIARQTRSGVRGVSRWRTPRWLRASITAFWTAGIDPTVPDSPIPLAPRGLNGVGVSVLDASYGGRPLLPPPPPQPGPRQGPGGDPGHAEAPVLGQDDVALAGLE